MIVVDSSAMIALMDESDRHHESLRSVYDADPAAWVLPWAILPEVDYLLHRVGGAAAALAFVRDLADVRFAIEWGDARDLVRAREISERYRTLGLGLVDCVVMAVAERRRAEAIATLDLRHFGAVKIRGGPQLLPRDLTA